jgi:hypothetical protein
VVVLVFVIVVVVVFVSHRGPSVQPSCATPPSLSTC